MTEIAYHPTHVRALRETFKALRTSEFPWTADTIYLNNASIGPIPERTRRALDEFTAKRTAPHLLPDRELFAGLAAARLGIAQLINANPSEIALATNTGFGLNLAARALPLKAGDIVLLSDKEFPANVYPWLMLRDQGITVEMARCTAQGWPDEEHLLQRLRDPKVRVLAVSFVQFSNGYRADLQKLGAACRANGTYLIVDGIQGIGNSVLDVTETPVDILACGGQKWLLSPWGSGFVYVRKELVPTHGVQPDVPRRCPPLRNDHAPLSGFCRDDGVARLVAGSRRAGHRRGDSGDARADREMGAGERRTDHFADRERPPLRDSLYRAGEAGRGVSRDEAGARGVQPARRLDSLIAPLLQHGRGDGEGDRSVGRSDVNDGYFLINRLSI
ncbi:MAG: hypothetical protein AUH41_08735 [Gemmatimonadetes bacterium 13_1_40CM_66_11]|nr:MAG: hypothetical protein AUH41_08735 [Gemmatimonadetes bacterium 13_1_40CM_66_11]